MGRRIDADSLICSLGHCECDTHTVHKLSHWLPATLAFPKAKIAFEREEICEFDGHITQAQSAASHRRLTSPTGEWLFTESQ